ncbi:MAG TPA: cytochrome c peroxidase [Terriglobales bacterium]|nr:cytochrome c peroxidase [Terriglobales bacterium]
MMQARVLFTFAVLVFTSAVGSAQPAAVTAPAAPPQPQPEVLKSGDYTLTLPLGLQAGAAYIPDDNPLSAAKIELGKMLYFDARLSKDSTVSCASCHNPFHGFADPARTSKGVRGAIGGRNSPTVINRLFSDVQFWDGRSEDLEAQAHGPLTNPVEMKMGSHDDVVGVCKAVPGYKPLFVKAFGSDEITMTRIAQAIAAYERTVVAGNSPFDRYSAGDKDAMSASAVRGMATFNEKGNCRVCHAGFNFTDESYHNIGVGMDKAKPDPGRHDQTKKPEDLGAFKTPTLRNIAQTAPYMHDGSETTLRQVVELYNRGGVRNANLSKEIKPLNLTPAEIDDVVAFLEALTGEINNADPPGTLPQ